MLSINILTLLSSVSLVVGFDLPLSAINCEYVSTTLKTAVKIKSINDIARLPCLGKCFFNQECSHIAYNAYINQCSLLAEGSIPLEMTNAEIYKVIQCEVPDHKRNKRNRRSFDSQLGVWDYSGVCCGTEKKKTKPVTRGLVAFAEMSGFSLELCFTGCQQLGCTALTVTQPKANGVLECKMYNISDTCSLSPEPSEDTDFYCDVRCYEGADLPKDICSGMKTTQPSEKSGEDNSQNFKAQMSSSVSACLDPCKIKVHQNGTNYITSVCKHGECTSKYIDPHQCYDFECHCYDDFITYPPFCALHDYRDRKELFESYKPKILITGGEQFKSSNEAFNIIENSSENLQMSLTQGRQGHVSIALEDHITFTVLVAGGKLKVSGVTGTTELINMNNTKSPETGPSMIVPRTDAAIAMLHHNVFVCGGADANDKELNSCEYYNPKTKTWTLLEARMKFARRGLAMTAFDGDLWVFGGSANSNKDGECRAPDCLTSMERWEYMGLYWYHFNDMNFPRKYAAAASSGPDPLYEKWIYIIGGGPVQIERMNIEHKTRLEVVGEMPYSRIGLHLFRFKSSFFIVGGNGEDSMDVLKYDMEEKRCRMIGSLNEERYKSSAALIFIQ